MNGIKDILTKTIDELTSIVDGTTPANKAYMQEQIFGILKAIGTSSYSENYLTISSSDEWPSYSELQTCLNDNDPDNYLTPLLQLVINIKENLTNEITAPKPYCLLKSDSKHFFKIFINTPITVNSMYFNNLTIELSQTSVFENSKFENCIITGNNDIKVKDNCTFENCIIANNGSFTVDGESSIITKCELLSDVDISLNTLKEFTFNKLKQIPINWGTININNLNYIL